MPRPATGNAYLNSRGRWYARVSLGGKLRPNIPLSGCADEAEAQGRAALLGELAAKLRQAGKVDLAVPLLKRAGERAAGRPLQEVVRVVDGICAGTIAPRKVAVMTFEDLGRRWTSGELHRDYRDHIAKKRSADTDAYRLERHVYPVIGAVPVDASFTLDTAEAVMKALPPELGENSRRQVAQAIRRLLAIATFPMRMIEVNPIPPGWLPRAAPKKAKSFLYPDEDAKLMRASVPLHWRMLYGFLAREGMRSTEATTLAWSDLDLERGVVELDKNKTDDPRGWALNPGVAEALRRWRALRGEIGTGPDDLVFADQDVNPVKDDHKADRFRAHLQAAGVDRPQLFEQSAARRHIWLHDLRGTFVTIALANGRSESWVSDRTGHQSSDQINTYRRRARSVAELGLGDLCSLALAVPELVEEPAGAIGAAVGAGPDDVVDTEPASSRNVTSSEDGGIGRRAGFRFQWGNSRGGSSPPLRTQLNDRRAAMSRAHRRESTRARGTLNGRHRASPPSPLGALCVDARGLAARRLRPQNGPRRGRPRRLGRARNERQRGFGPARRRDVGSSRRRAIGRRGGWLGRDHAGLGRGRRVVRGGSSAHGCLVDTRGLGADGLRGARQEGVRRQLERRRQVPQAWGALHRRT